MIPAVAEVIEVAERLAAGVGQNGGEARFPGVERPVVDSVGIGFAPAGAADAELVEMRVGPAHGGLDRQMQAIETDVGRHDDASHHLGLDMVERDLQYGEGRLDMGAI